MPDKNSAVDKLSALKTRHEGTGRSPNAVEQIPDLGKGGILPQSLWIGLAVILALGAATSLTLSYRDLRRLADRERTLNMKLQNLADCDQRLSALNTDIAKLNARAEQLKAEIKETEGDAAKGAEAAAAYKMFSAMLPSLKAEMENLSGRVEALRGEKSTLDDATAKAQAILNITQNAKTNTLAALDQLERDMALRKADVAALDVALASNKASLAVCTQSAQEQKDECTAVKRDRDNKRQDRDEALRERDQARGTLTGLQDSVMRLRSERATATNELAEMSAELARVTTKISVERKTLADLEVEKTKLTSEVPRLTAAKVEYDAIVQKKDETGRQLASLTQQVESQKTLFAERTAVAMESKKQVDALDTKRLELERAVHELIGQQTALETKGATSNRK
jgi:chromosome segregation ATPase